LEEPGPLSAVRKSMKNSLETLKKKSRDTQQTGGHVRNKTTATTRKGSGVLTNRPKQRLKTEKRINATKVGGIP